MLHAFQLSNGAFGLVFATTPEHAARVVFAEYGEDVTLLNAAGIDIRADFFTLGQSQIQVLLALAKIQGYRHPKNANGSKARYYFAALQRKYYKE